MGFDALAKEAVLTLRVDEYTDIGFFVRNRSANDVVNVGLLANFINANWTTACDVDNSNFLNLALSAPTGVDNVVLKYLQGGAAGLPLNTVWLRFQLQGTENPVGETTTLDDCEATTGWAGSTDADAPTLNGATFKEGSNSISLAKSGTTVDNFSYDKTLGSFDATGKQLWVWVYLVDADDLNTGTAIDVLVGDGGATNYYLKSYQLSDLADGWNLLGGVPSTEFTRVGTPNIASLELLRIKLYVPNAASTIASDRVLMDYWKLETYPEADVVVFGKQKGRR